jgi:L-galactose dehydrogenase
MGLLTSAGPPEWHPAPPELKAACAAAAAYCASQGQDIAKLALQFAVQ